MRLQRGVTRFEIQIQLVLTVVAILICTYPLQAAAPAEGVGGGEVAGADPHGAGQGGERRPGPCQWPRHQLGGGELNLIEYLFRVPIDNYF